MRSHGGRLPRLKPLHARRSATLSVLDIGTSKIVCLVAELQPAETLEALRGRTHLAQVIGIGCQRAAGMKGGAVVDLDAAETAIRQAVAAAERMAGVEVQSVIVNLTGGRIGARSFAAEIDLDGASVTARDVQRALDAADAQSSRPGRAALHAVASGFSLDGQSQIVDPLGMVGAKLGVDLAVVTADAAPARNLMLAVERCHLGVEAVIATPYASGLSTLVDDESEMGAVVVDFGAGTTTMGVFTGGRLVHADGVAVGGHHVTLDIARGLTARVSDAEQIKVAHGSALVGSADERELVAVPQLDESERELAVQLPKAQLVRIIRPRVEEVLELVRDRLRGAGFGAQAGRRVVLTGGASQLPGLPEIARRMLQGQVRLGRPLGIRGLPDAAKGPAFAASVGLLVSPQVAQLEHLSGAGRGAAGAAGDGYLSRVGRWIRESF